MGEPDPECELLTWDGYEITITLLDGSRETRQVYPSEEGLDADGDDVDDCVEFHQRTDPNDPDTTDDGLLDGLNVTLESQEPLAQEWIEQGIVHEEGEDGQIVFFGAHDWGMDPTMQDTVGSGILDGEEIGGFSVWILDEELTVRTDPDQRDTSGDGMVDGDKRRLGLDPTTRDTDSDGIPDHDDINPWVEFQVRLEVESLILREDPHGRSKRDVWLSLRLQGDEFQSLPNEVRVDETVDGEQFSSSTLDPSDAGGAVERGQHNLTFTLSVFSEENGDLLLLDFFSQTTETTSLIGAIHALTGDLYTGGQQDRHSWPSTATFQGDHGDITLRLVPVWPEPWQSCIDDGCRHGDGQFQWR